jgi:aryl-phospho-beta-D-glucosidase BglC (GH1 family)
MKTKNSLALIGFITLLSVCINNVFANNNRFIHIQGKDLITPDGKKFLIRGTNLGNWLNPEGYMFFFQDVSCFHLINAAFSEIAGPDFTRNFWKEFRNNYITKEDIAYIKKTGMNSIRLPFHYKLFTDEEYMGSSSDQDGFVLFDRVLNWCREVGLYVVLDMHDAPGGQTGTNIDDSYGYPYLFESEENQQQFCAVWKRIAQRYANDTIIIGYDLLNEPVAPEFKHLNSFLEPLYIRCTKAIREVDKNHIVMLGGAQWDGNFEVFTDWKFDDKMMYTCHRYWCDTLQTNIQDFVDFREKVQRPIYMGETGENTDEWVGTWRRLMEANNIGWHYWPYKKMAKGACMLIIPTPENWNLIVEYTKKDRSSYKKINEARPDRVVVQKVMKDLLENMKFSNCKKNVGYIQALGMNP